MMAEPSNREIVERFVRAVESKDVAAQLTMLADDFYDEMPQSGERTRGKANWQAIIDHYPGGVGTVDPASRRIVGADDRWVMTPSFSILRIEGSGDTFTYAGTITYSNGDLWHIIVIAHLRDGKLARTTTWYAAPFDAPEWRAPYVERFEPPHP
jgi:ketosteroid isomerase-like protein